MKQVLLMKRCGWYGANVDSFSTTDCHLIICFAVFKFNVLLYKSFCSYVYFGSDKTNKLYYLPSIRKTLVVSVNCVRSKNRCPLLPLNPIRCLNVRLRICEYRKMANDAVPSVQTTS